jgi:hypothetical protein
MHSWLKENNRHFASLSSFSLILFYSLQYFYNWPLLKLSGILGAERYLDLVSIQNMAKCVNSEGIRVYEIGKSCSGYQYSLGILHVFDFTGFSGINRNLAAAILEIPVLLLMAALLFLAFRKSNRVGVFTFIALVSPGNWLLLERGNLDLIMLSCIFLAAKTFQTKFELFGFCALLLSVLTKFYAAPLLILYIFFGEPKLRLKVFAPITLLVYLFTLFQISLVSQFPSTWYVSFGSRSIGHWINLFLEQFARTSYRLSEQTGFIIGTLLLVASVIVQLKVFKAFKVESTPFTSISSRGFLFFGLTFLGCYALGMNYDYRLIFPICASVFLLVKDDQIPFKTYFIVISTASFWLSSFFYGQYWLLVIFQHFLGDIFVGLLASYTSAYFVMRYKTALGEKVSKCLRRD